MRPILTSILILLAFAPAAQAHTSIDGDARYQRMVDNAKMPTPSVLVKVTPDVAGTCGGVGFFEACAIPALIETPYTIAITSRKRYAFLHELGHVYDWTLLDDADRKAFMRLAGYPRSFTWYTERGVYDQPLEEFADAYALCAMYGRHQPPYSFWATYGYWPTPRKTHKKVCQLLRTATRLTAKENT